MKYLVLLAFVGVAVGQEYRAVRNANEIIIVKSENENNGDGTFRWATELSDGTKMDQNGYIKDGPDPENPIQVIQGSFSYTSPDGTPIYLKYVADENGFQPEGEHLPTPPPVPEAIQKALDIILRNADKQAAASNVQQQYRQPNTLPRVNQPGRF